jgi:hypothetical protein
MSADAAPAETDPDRSAFALTPQQVHFFETFGFVRLPGLFAEDIGAISTAFDEAARRATAEGTASPEAPADYGDYGSTFADVEAVVTHDHVHFGARRVILPMVVERNEPLAYLTTDPRVVGVVHSLIGPEYEAIGSDGNVFSCDTAWHCDIFQSPLEQLHVKLFLYLDRLDSDSGAIRVIPGTNHWDSPYAATLRRDLADHGQVEERFGVAVDEVPSWTVPNEPGDLIVGAFRTIHATYGGAPGRRLIALSFKEPARP